MKVAYFFVPGVSTTANHPEVRNVRYGGVSRTAIQSLTRNPVDLAPCGRLARAAPTASGKATNGNEFLRTTFNEAEPSPAVNDGACRG